MAAEPQTGKMAAVHTPGVRLIAHRGFAAEHPENTLAAVRAAAEQADVVEVDVRRCGSCDLVVIHDATVDRATDGTGRVDAHTLAELRDLSVLGSGHGVPTLADLPEVLPPSVGINVEFKEPVVADALPALRQFDGEVVVSSFDPGILATVAEVAPDLPTALLVADAEDAVERARDLGCAAVHPEWSACDPELVERAHEAGLSVNAWTVEHRETADRLAEMGVDGVIADRHDVV